MRKHFLGAVAALGFVAIASVGCSDSQEITSKTIINEVNEMWVKQGNAEKTVNITIGHYECNSESDRYQLAQLESAGLIKYNVKRYAWWEKEEVSVRKPYQVKETRGGWYYTWTETVTKYKWVRETVYDFEEHYIVDVKLTRAGEKLLAKVHEAEEEFDKDLASKEVDPSTYKWNKQDLSESWPEIPNPFLKPEPEVRPQEVTTEPEEIEEVPITYEPEEVEEVEAAEPAEQDKVERIDQELYEAYNREVFDSENVTLKAGEIKAIKARNILLKETNGALAAEAEVIFETCNATDAGRIIMGFENGKRNAQQFEFIYYLDKGWVIRK